MNVIFQLFLTGTFFCIHMKCCSIIFRVSKGYVMWLSLLYIYISSIDIKVFVIVTSTTNKLTCVMQYSQDTHKLFNSSASFLYSITSVYLGIEATSKHSMVGLWNYLFHLTSFNGLKHILIAIETVIIMLVFYWHTCYMVYGDFM